VRNGCCVGFSAEEPLAALEEQYSAVPEGAAWVLGWGCGARSLGGCGQEDAPRLGAATRAPRCGARGGGGETPGVALHSFGVSLPPPPCGRPLRLPGANTPACGNLAVLLFVLVCLPLDVGHDQSRRPMTKYTRSMCCCTKNSTALFAVDAAPATAVHGGCECQCYRLTGATNNPRPV